MPSSKSSRPPVALPSPPERVQPRSRGLRVRTMSPFGRPEWGEVPGVQRLPEGESTQLQVRAAFQREFEDEEIIFDEGDQGVVLYVIQSGQVEICRPTEVGARSVAKLGPGDFFGEMSVVLGEARTARAVAIGETRLLELDGDTLEAMCIERPEVGIRMIRRLATRLIGAERRLAALGLDELVHPLVRCLIERAPQDAREDFRLHTSLRELSEGCSMPMRDTYEAIHQLMDRKLVRLSDGVLIAPDRAALAEALAPKMPGGQDLAQDEALM